MSAKTCVVAAIGALIAIGAVCGPSQVSDWLVQSNEELSKFDGIQFFKWPEKRKVLGERLNAISVQLGLDTNASTRESVQLGVIEFVSQDCLSGSETYRYAIVTSSALSPTGNAPRELLVTDPSGDLFNLLDVIVSSPKGNIFDPKGEHPLVMNSMACFSLYRNGEWRRMFIADPLEEDITVYPTDEPQYVPYARVDNAVRRSQLINRDCAMRIVFLGVTQRASRAILDLPIGRVQDCLHMIRRNAGRMIDPKIDQMYSSIVGKPMPGSPPAPNVTLQKLLVALFVALVGLALWRVLASIRQ